MKQRILGRLFELSTYDGSVELEEMTQLKKYTGLEDGDISRKAGVLLKSILNDYSGFSVGTIDKFFQSVIRAFTREIGIQPGYNLELDNNRILSLAVDRLYQDISEETDLQRWLIRYAEERMEESRSWNFRNDIVQLGMQLFREAFQGLFIDQDLSVLEKEKLDIFLKDLKREEEDTLRKMVEIGNAAKTHLGHAGLSVSDFKLKGNSPPSLFIEAAEGRNVNFTQSKQDSLVQSIKWLNKGATTQVIELTEKVLMPLLNQLYTRQKVLNTIGAIRQNFYTLGILGDLWERVKSYTRERNLFLIADSSRFLRGIIGGNQVPFIYERTGNRYSHIMLDEFQDTSVFQYDNFKPLLENSLASGHSNLVVGDVKQAIYRWRNSDWKILASELETDFKHQEFHIHRLAHNYRSREQIIRFNNTIFQLAPAVLAQTIENELYGSAIKREEAESEIGRFRNAYADAVQQIPENLKGTGGKVKIEFVDKVEGSSFEYQLLTRLPEWILEIQNSGIDPGEIAILVRSRREGIAVTNALLEHARKTGETQKFRLISNESLLLVHNTSVALVISVLRYLICPGDELNNANLKYQCDQVGMFTDRSTFNLFDTSISIDQLLPEGFLRSIQLLRQLSIYELIESLISLFGLDKRPQDLPYLQALQDLVIEVHRKEPQGIGDFLHFWEQHGLKKGISVSEESNAIRILTIHKAKGLEFKAVIVPFCNWEITTDHKKANILWCETKGTPFDKIPMVPIKFSSKMAHTLFSPAYFQERMKGYMDNLNLMYVAFTRAKDVLYIGIPEKEGNNLRSTGDLIWDIKDLKPKVSPALESLEIYRSGKVFSLGSFFQFEKRLEPDDPWQFTTYPVNRRIRALKVRRRSDEYFVDEEGRFRTGLMYGNVMHKVFSRISSVHDVDSILTSMQKDGLLPEKDRCELQERILKMVTQPGVERWFSVGNKVSVYNERSILCGEGKVLRPDRVIVEGDNVTVIDFKFGEVEKNFYKEQVRNYMVQLGKAGYRNVEGFVWYVMLGKTIQIDKV